jgi:hypothetical protein
MVLLVAMFALTACGTGNKDDDELSAIPGNADTQALEDEHSTCWQTSVVEGLYDLMSRTTIDVYTKITNGALSLMLVAFAVWFSFRILAHVSSFVEENPSEVWTEVTRKLFLCVTCGIIANSPEILLFVLNITLFPIYNAFLEFGSELLAKASAKEAGTLTMFGKEVGAWSTGQSIICKADKLAPASVAGGFPEGPKQMMMCMICSINQRLNLGFALAFEVMSAPGLMSTIIGILVIVCFTFVKLGFVFYVVDTVFKFAVMIMIMPLLVMGYAFEYTKGWLGKGVAQILNSGAFMMFVAIVIAMTMMAIEELINGNPKIFNPAENESQEAFREFSIPFMCLMMICFLITTSIGVAQQVTDSLVGGNSKSEFNKKVVVIASMIGNWLSGGMLKVVQKIAFVRKAADKVNRAKSKLKHLAGKE